MCNADKMCKATYREPFLTIRFADDRVIACFHFKAVRAGTRFPSPDTTQITLPGRCSGPSE